MKYLWLAIATTIAAFCWGASSFLYGHEGSPEVALALFLLAEFIFSGVCGYILMWLLWGIFGKKGPR